MAETGLSKINGLMQVCKAGREAYLDAVKKHDEMTAAIIRSEHVASVIEAANQPDAAAVLMRLANPDLGMVEQVGEGSNREIVRVMALALFAGFTPGKQEFAIFNGRTKSSLYLKDAGIRRLLVQMGCTPPEVQVGFPALMDLRPGQQVWAVDGEVSTTHGGKKYVCSFRDKNAVKLPAKFFKGSNDTSDNIDGIIAKARRRMLLELMRVVQSAAGSLAEDDSDDDTVGGGEVTVIETASAALPAPAPAVPDFIEEVAALQTKLSPEHATLLGDAHADIAGAVSQQQLRTVWEAVNAAAKETKLDKRAVDLLVRIKDLKKGQLQ